MDSATIIQLLQAAGYKTGHAHYSVAPPGQPDCILIVYMEKDQLPPFDGLIEHIESEEPDIDCAKVVSALQRRMEGASVQAAPNGGAVFIYPQIAAPCTEVNEAAAAIQQHIVITARGSSALN